MSAFLASFVLAARRGTGLMRWRAHLDGASLLAAVPKSAGTDPVRPLPLSPPSAPAPSSSAWRPATFPTATMAPRRLDHVAGSRGPNRPGAAEAIPSSHSASGASPTIPCSLLLNTATRAVARSRSGPGQRRTPLRNAATARREPPTSAKPPKKQATVKPTANAKGLVTVPALPGTGNTPHSALHDDTPSGNTSLDSVIQRENQRLERLASFGSFLSDTAKGRG